MKILCVCPSIHLEKYNKMLHTFEITASKNVEIKTCSNFTVTESINNIFNKYPDYDYYHIGNDDTSYETPLWDIKLAQKGKITYGNDLLQGENLPTFPMIDGDIVRALGWLQLPSLNRYCGDVVWKYIGEQLGILEYHNDVIIAHHWEGCADEEVNRQDGRAFAQWLPWSFRDLEKIRRALK